MPIETWFPLAIYFDDLADAPQHRQALLEAVLQLERDGEDRRAYPEMSWTGDLHGVEQIQVVYPPVAGRLLMFPAKQRHAVTLNETSDLRVSLSFDIVLTAKDGETGSYEFLASSPSQWRRFR